MVRSELVSTTITFHIIQFELFSHTC